jgi:hypothetical protein
VPQPPRNPGKRLWLARAWHGAISCRGWQRFQRWWPHRWRR